MKKILLSTVIVVLAYGASAQLYSEHFSSGALDSNKVVLNFFNDGSGTFIEQGSGPFIPTLNTECSQLEFATLGHDEWDVIRVYFDAAHTTISMTSADTIFLRVKLDESSTDAVAKIGIGVSDNSGKTALNEAVQAVNAATLSKTSWSLIKYVVTNWEDQWGNGGLPNGTVDNTKIQRVNIAVNGGFGSFPVPGVNDKALEGTLLIDYVQIGGSAPAAGVCSTSIDELSSIADNFSIYPNPASSTATIAFNAKERSELTFDIYAVTGAKIESFSKTANPGQITFDYAVRHLDAGLYFVKVSANGTPVSTQKLYVN